MLTRLILRSCQPKFNFGGQSRGAAKLRKKPPSPIKRSTLPSLPSSDPSGDEKSTQRSFGPEIMGLCSMQSFVFLHKRNYSQAEEQPARLPGANALCAFSDRLPPFGIATNCVVQLSTRQANWRSISLAH